MTDPIADMLTRIKNALAAHKAEMRVPHSRVKEQIAQVLLAAGYLTQVEVVEAKPQKEIVITLKYNDLVPTITQIKRESRPGCRTYVSTKEIPQVLGGFGMCIVSTSSGIMSGQDARAKNLGGELICTLW